MNAYLIASGVIVGLQVFCIAVVVALVMIALRLDRRREQAAREADQAVTQVSRWRHDEDKIADEAEAWLRNGGLSG